MKKKQRLYEVKTRKTIKDKNINSIEWTTRTRTRTKEVKEKNERKFCKNCSTRDSTPPCHCHACNSSLRPEHLSDHVHQSPLQGTHTSETTLIHPSHSSHSKGSHHPSPSVPLHSPPSHHHHHHAVPPPPSSQPPHSAQSPPPSPAQS